MTFSQRCQRGFTLLETLVALSILAVAAVGILSSLGVETDSLRRAKQAQSVDALLGELLVQVSAHEALLPEETVGTTADGQLAWRVTVSEPKSANGTSTPGLQDVMIIVAPARASMEPDARAVHTRHFGVGSEAPL